MPASLTADAHSRLPSGSDGVRLGKRQNLLVSDGALIRGRLRHDHQQPRDSVERRTSKLRAFAFDGAAGGVYRDCIAGCVEPSAAAMPSAVASAERCPCDANQRDGSTHGDYLRQ